ncbi:MAG: cell division protein SepF, partial [Clostridia bacterium]|nr:cell division protein SepF [Clostridia bacterium]
MGIFDKIKDLIGADDDDFYDDDEEMDLVPAKQQRSESTVSPAPALEERKLSVIEPSGSSGSKKQSNKVVNIHTTAQLQVVLVKPERFDDEAAPIADHLLEKRTVVLNLEKTNKDVSRRLVDFLSGVAYAVGGQIKRVANSTFIITPYNVNIMGDLLDELEST